MQYTFDTRKVFDKVDKVFDEAEGTLNKVFSTYWNIIEHPEFPFVSLESTTNTARNFPPYNITESKEGQVQLDIAVAGYTKDRLSVELEGNTLLIRGVPDKSPATGIVRKQGISNAAFLRSFTMQPHTKVDGVSLQDGILSIVVSTPKPETSKTTFEIK